MPENDFSIGDIFQKKTEIDISLQRIVGYFPYDESIIEGIRYILLSNGKRIRPILGLLILEAFIKKKDIFIDILSLIEVIHSYSLIHDDLPCMDDDDLRRGRATLHKAYNVPYATHIGSIILDQSLYIMMDLLIDAGIESPQRIKILELVDDHIGFKGMVGGQILDMQLSSETELLSKKYIKMIELKTARLIELSVKIACLLGGIDEKGYRHLSDYAKNIGLLFQMIDDLLEIIGDETIIGKSIKSDEKNQKITAVRLFGKDSVEMFADSLYFNSLKALEPFGNKTGYLKEFAKFLRYRNK